MGQAGVAQLAEQRFRKPQVGGSIPLAGSIYQALTLPPLAQMVAVLNLC